MGDSPHFQRGILERDGQVGLKQEIDVVQVIAGSDNRLGPEP